MEAKEATNEPKQASQECKIDGELYFILDKEAEWMYLDEGKYLGKASSLFYCSRGKFPRKRVMNSHRPQMLGKGTSH